MENNQQKIEIKATEETFKGVYANNALIMHTQNEFVIDFMSILPPKGMLGARVIMSPSAMKRVLQALQTNIARYEQQHGEIELGEEPSPQKFTH